MRKPILKKTLIGITLVLWIGSMLTGLWWYKSRFIRPFSETTTVFSGQQLRLPDALAGAGKIRFVHFWDPACPCNVGNQQHLVEMLNAMTIKLSFIIYKSPAAAASCPKH